MAISLYFPCSYRCFKMQRTF